MCVAGTRSADPSPRRRRREAIVARRHLVSAAVAALYVATTRWRPMTIIAAPARRITMGTISHHKRMLDTRPTAVTTTPIMIIRVSGAGLRAELRSHATNPAATTSRIIRRSSSPPVDLTQARVGTRRHFGRCPILGRLPVMARPCTASSVIAAMLTDVGEEHCQPSAERRTALLARGGCSRIGEQQHARENEANRHRPSVSA